ASPPAGLQGLGHASASAPAKQPLPAARPRAGRGRPSAIFFGAAGDDLVWRRAGLAVRRVREFLETSAARKSAGAWVDGAPGPGGVEAAGQGRSRSGR